MIPDFDCMMLEDVRFEEFSGTLNLYDIEELCKM